MKRQGRIYQQSERLQEIARGMRIIGMRFDEQRRLEHLENYTAKRDVARGVLDEIASINPRSPDQLRRLVFEEWGLPWQDITDSGLPSTGAASVRQLLMSGTCSEEQSTYLKPASESSWCFVSNTSAPSSRLGAIAFAPYSDAMV